MIRSTRKRRRMTTITEVSLTPLIDTALTLLVIFMVTTPLVNNAIKITLPSGKAREDNNARQELVVYVEWDQKAAHEQLYFNGTRVSNKQQLIDIVKKAVGQNKEQMVFVKGDVLVPYGNIVELVDEIKVVGGVSYVALATKRA